MKKNNIHAESSDIFKPFYREFFIKYHSVKPIGCPVENYVFVAKKLDKNNYTLLELRAIGESFQLAAKCLDEMIDDYEENPDKYFKKSDEIPYPCFTLLYKKVDKSEDE